MRPVIEPVHLRSGHRHHIHRALNLAARPCGFGRNAPGLVAHAAITVVMALQHQVHGVALEQRLPGGFQRLGIFRAGAGKYRLVSDNDIPARGAVFQALLKPAGLLIKGAHIERRGAIKDDKPYALIVDKIRGVLHPFDAVLRQGELAAPVRPESSGFAAVGVEAVEVFVVTGGQHLGDHRVVEPACLVPFTPLVVVHQVFAL